LPVRLKIRCGPAFRFGARLPENVSVGPMVPLQEFLQEMKDALVRALTEDLKERRRSSEEIVRELDGLDKAEVRGKLSAAERQRQTDLKQQSARLQPSWLRWSRPQRYQSQQRPVEELAEETKPVVLARYTSGLPFMIERRVGQGRILLITTSTADFEQDHWNTLSTTDAVLIYDRILRSMLQDTFPERNISTERRILLPVTPAERNARFLLLGPDGQEETLSVDPVGSGRYGVIVGERPQRGIYRVRAVPAKGGSGAGAQTKPEEIALAINGPAEESELIAPTDKELRQRTGHATSAQTAQATAAGLQRADLQTTDLWRWLMVAVLACLLVELAVLAWPALGGERNA
jgi:hypothetical protein